MPGQDALKYRAFMSENGTHQHPMTTMSEVRTAPDCNRFSTQPSLNTFLIYWSLTQNTKTAEWKITTNVDRIHCLLHVFTLQLKLSAFETDIIGSQTHDNQITRRFFWLISNVVLDAANVISADGNVKTHTCKTAHCHLDLWNGSKHSDATSIENIRLGTVRNVECWGCEWSHLRACGGKWKIVYCTVHAISPNHCHTAQWFR